MKDVMLLDCTLRDGGYLNNWNFGAEHIVSITERLKESNIDIIEIGFLDERNSFDLNRTIQPSTDAFNKTYSFLHGKKPMILAMIDYGTCSIDNLQEKSKTVIDGIRVIFKKENMFNAVEFGKKIIEKGYLLFLQMVSITSYGEDDVIEFANAVNSIHPFAVSIVDTYGLMHKDRALEYYRLLDSNLDKSIRIGYHSHNNFQLAYSNTIELLNNRNNDRKLILDGTLYGMGKSAGNAPIELLAMYLNDNCDSRYNINQMLETIRIDILPIYEKTGWGYSYFYYIAAKNSCHPKYVEYLSNKKTLTIESINKILEKIDASHKLKFDKDLIEMLFTDYVINTFNDKKVVTSLSKIFNNKSLLLIGPGKSITNNQKKIIEVSKRSDIITISINFIPDFINTDYVFISKSERYNLLINLINNAKIKVIATSNVLPVEKQFDYVLNYGDLITDLDDEWNNAILVLINLVEKMNPKKLYLAGLDGFNTNNDNYFDSKYNVEYDAKKLNAVNEWTKKKLKKYSSNKEIEFITKSMYQ